MRSQTAAADTQTPPKSAEAKPDSPAAPPITVDGRIKAVDADTGTVTITHGPIAEIGMPGMTMAFALTDALDPAGLPLDEDLTLTFKRPDGVTMVLDAVAPKFQPITVSGRINSINTAAGTANITHGPIAEIGMPGMTMDFAMSGDVDPGRVPLGHETELLLVQGADMALSLVGTVELGQ